MTQTPPTHELKPHRAQLLLTIACVGFVLCAPIGIFACPMANADLAAMDADFMDPSGRQSTKWAKWIGMANVAQVVLMIVAVPLTCMYFMSLLEEFGNL